MKNIKDEILVYPLAQYSTMEQETTQPSAYIKGLQNIKSVRNEKSWTLKEFPCCKG